MTEIPNVRATPAEGFDLSLLEDLAVVVAEQLRDIRGTRLSKTVHVDGSFYRIASREGAQSSSKCPTLHPGPLAYPASKRYGWTSLGSARPSRECRTGGLAWSKASRRRFSRRPGRWCGRLSRCTGSPYRALPTR